MNLVQDPKLETSLREPPPQEIHHVIKKGVFRMNSLGQLFHRYRESVLEMGCARAINAWQLLEIRRQLFGLLLTARDALFSLLFPAPRCAFNHQRMDLLHPDKLQSESPGLT